MDSNEALTDSTVYWTEYDHKQMAAALSNELARIAPEQLEEICRRGDLAHAEKVAAIQAKLEQEHHAHWIKWERDNLVRALKKRNQPKETRKYLKSLLKRGFCDKPLSDDDRQIVDGVWFEFTAGINEPTKVWIDAA